MADFEQLNQKFFDKLDRIFELQKALDKEIWNNALERRDAVELPLVEQKVFGLCTAIIHEAAELQRLLNWKWWKVPVKFDHKAAKEESIDILHFVVSLLITLGMTPADILSEYEKKNKINHQRQENGY